jgi:uncharacterized membrane protein YozB (DUF420 family)
MRTTRGQGDGATKGLQMDNQDIQVRIMKKKINPEKKYSQFNILIRHRRTARWALSIWFCSS